MFSTDDGSGNDKKSYEFQENFQLAVDFMFDTDTFCALFQKILFHRK